MTSSLIAMGMGGPYDIAIVAVVILVLFGGAKLTELGKGVGSGIREFKKATKDDDIPVSSVNDTKAG